MSIIPVLDCDGSVVEKRKELLDALSDGGFVYLKNCGITKQTVEAVFDVSRKFWALDEIERQQYSRDGNVSNNGYIGIGVERLQGRAISDIKKAFNISPFEEKPAYYPKEVPDFRAISHRLMDECFAVTKNVLELLDKEFGNRDDVMIRGHDGTLKGNGMLNGTTLRMLHYPPVDKDMHGNKELMRCGEHADYGSLTFLFQEDVGGLEVQTRSGEFVPVTPVKDAVLLNTGSLMARWTSNRIQAVRHRVRIPASDENTLNTYRHSVACFIHPDDDFLISPLDGTCSYSPITAGGYMKAQFAKSY